MGSVTSTLDSSNKMVNVTANLPSKVVLPQSVSSQYINYVNSAGVIIATINLANLSNYLQTLATQYNPSNTQVTANVGLGSIMILGMGSMTGLFTLQASAPDSKIINIVIPKILLDQTNGPAFLNFLSNAFSPALNPGQTAQAPQLQQFNNIMTSIIVGLNKNSSNPQIRLANILNILFYGAYIQGINMATNSSANMTNQNLITLFTGLITEIVSNIPDDKCILSHTEYMQFTPDICNSNSVFGNLTSVASTKSSTSKSNQSDTLLLVGGGLILFIVLMLLVVLIMKSRGGHRRRYRDNDDD